MDELNRIRDKAKERICGLQDRAKEITYNV